jgi:hypothetical protein
VREIRARFARDSREIVWIASRYEAVAALSLLFIEAAAQGGVAVRREAQVSRFRFILAGALIAVAPLACRSSGRVYEESSGGDVALPNNTVGVEVKNDNFADVDVYAIIEGQARRLGTVTGNTTKSFSLRASDLVTGTVRLVAEAIGSAASASSGQMAVGGGQTVVFHIAPAINQSSASVRNQ